MVVDNGASLAITLFVIIINICLLIVGLNKQIVLSRNIFLNIVFKRSCLLIMFYLMTLNSAIMASISNSIGLGVNKEMFLYMFLFGYGGYLFMFFIGIKTLFDVVKMWNVKEMNKQMGGDGDDEE